MAKKRPPKPPRTEAPDPHTALMAGDTGTQPERRIRKPQPDREAPKDTDTIRAEQRVKRWEERLTRSNKVYEEWQDEFECKHLDQYYDGKQWRGISEEEAKGRYVTNLVFATVESQLPSLLFSKPKVKVEARPTHQQTLGNEAGARATLIEQACQTVFDDPKVKLPFQTSLALRDAYARYGVVEVGYSADWIDNPNAGKPVLLEDKTPVQDESGEPVTEPKRVLAKGSKETVYLRRIDPDTVRVSPGRNVLSENDWVAYYEWVPRNDVRRNPEYDHAEDVEATGKLEPSTDDEYDAMSELGKRAGMVKLWKIFDLRRKVRLVHAEGHKHLLQEKPMPECGLAVLKFYERRNSFLPVPPIFNWLGPQDEINETRESMRTHRRRFVRRYMAEPGVDKTELEKLENGPDGTTVNVPKTTPPMIVPIQDAPLHPQNTTEELATTKQDLNDIAGVTGESRNTPSAPTATQANIMNVRQSIRESRARQQVADWLAEIARLILLVMRERMVLPWMVKKTVDPFAAMQDPQNVLTSAKLWQQIKSEDLADLDVDISIDVASLSPVAEDAQRNQWNVVLALLSNPQLGMWLFTPNPQAPQEPTPLLRKTLVLNGITSDQEIREIWRVGQAILSQAAEAAAAQAALSKQPEPMKLSLSLKAEDLALFSPLTMMTNPVMQAVAAYILASVGNQQAVTAAASARPEPPMAGGNGSGGLTLPAPTGVPSGTPSKAPTGVA